MILKVLGKKVGFKTLEQKVGEIWKLQHDFELTDLEEGYFIARFRNKEEYDRVLDGGPWIIQGHYVTISKWRPEFRASSNKILSTLVWIQVPGLPVEYYTEDFLMKLGNTLGKAVKID